MTTIATTMTDKVEKTSPPLSDTVADERMIPQHEDLDVGYKASIDNVINAKYQLRQLQKKNETAQKLADEKNNTRLATEKYLKILQLRNRRLPRLLKLLTCSEQ